VQSRAHVLSKPFAIVGCVMLVALLASATSCDWLPPTPTPAPAATPTLVSTPTPVPIQTPVGEIPLAILSARDALLVFLRNQYPGKAPWDGVVWSGRDTTPLRVVAVSTYEFAADSWAMTVAAVSISPSQTLYELGLYNSQTGLHWTGRLDATYHLLESDLNVAVEVLLARETVLAYVREYYASQAPADTVGWIGERTTPFGMVGHETCQFTAMGSGELAAGAWRMTVDYDLLPLLQRVYKVDLSQAGTGFVWRGQVDAEGTVLEHR
jgi:hypothetical protein